MAKGFYGKCPHNKKLLKVPNIPDMPIKRIQKRVSPFVRINTRIRADQMKFIKAYAKKKRITEGEAHRALLDNYMMNV